MQKFSADLPFKRELKIHVTLEGEVSGVDLGALQHAVNLAALKTLTPTYLPWLESKGGECPGAYPSVLPHAFNVTKGECDKCREPIPGVASPAPEAPVEVKESKAQKLKAKSPGQAPD